MAQVEANTSGVVITITDPVEMERLMVVLHRTKSTKVIALRQAIIAALTEVAADELITNEVVEGVLEGFEKLLGESE